MGQLSAGRISCKFERPIDLVEGTGLVNLRDPYHILLAKGDVTDNGELEWVIRLMKFQ